MKKKVIIITIIIAIALVLGVILTHKSKKPSNNRNSNITLGKYYINDSKLEPIEWIKLTDKDDRELLVTKYALDCVAYNSSLENITWAGSDIKKWLNNDFYNLAFTSDEKSKITNGVFLLSKNDINEYMKDKEDRLLKPTKYALDNGCYINSDGYVAWWLSSPFTKSSPEYLASSGDFGTREHKANETIIAARPAMWIKK